MKLTGLVILRVKLSVLTNRMHLLLTLRKMFTDLGLTTREMKLLRYRKLVKNINLKLQVLTTLQTPSSQPLPSTPIPAL